MLRVISLRARLQGNTYVSSCSSTIYKLVSKKYIAYKYLFPSVKFPAKSVQLRIIVIVSSAHYLLVVARHTEGYMSENVAIHSLTLARRNVYLHIYVVAASPMASLHLDFDIPPPPIGAGLFCICMR